MSIAWYTRRSVSTCHRPRRPLGRVEVCFYSIFDFGTRRRWGVSVTSRPHFTPGKDPVSIVQEAGWASGPVWTGAENLTPTGIWSPDRPARRQSLYRLSYPAHASHDIFLFKYHFLHHILHLFLFSDNITADVASKQQTTALFLSTIVTRTRKHTELIKKLTNLMGNLCCARECSFLHS
jgi:hypothetical protein